VRPLPGKAFSGKRPPGGRSSSAGRPGTLLLGAHLSIAGGCHKAIERGDALGCTAVQIFTKNQVQWRAKPLSREDVERYRNAFHPKGGVRIVCAHGSYLYNLASPSRGLVGRSIAGILDELDRCDRLGVPYLVIHPGSHRGEGEKAGMDRIAKALQAVFGGYGGGGIVCLETTAGQGSSLGWDFRQLGRIIRSVGDPRVGACIDTCHVFAAGYDIRTKRSYRSAIGRFGDEVGMDRLKVIHLNDSRGGLGSRLDRHTHIGKGEIGLDAFGFFLEDRRFRDIPKVIETPKILKGRAMDGKNLQILRKLAGAV
jgi:deoxyribonuclease-4